MLDVDDLQTFVEVANAGGVSPAARRLGVSKSIVSRRLSRLETDLGIQLLARTTRGAALTEAGAIFREHAARICAELDLARETILPTGELRGLLRVAAPLTFGPMLAPAFARMALQHPSLNVTACYTDRFVDIVSEGFDCAVRVGFLPDSNLIARKIAPMFARLVASPAYLREHGTPQTVDELLAHEALLQGTETWKLRENGKLINVRPQGRFKADNGAALIAAAVAGLGIVAMPDFLIMDELEAGVLTTVMPQFPMPEFGAFVVRPPTQYPARKIRVLTELLIEHCKPIGVRFRTPKTLVLA